MTATGVDGQGRPSPGGRLPIRLTIPAQSRLLRLARMTAATVAADVGFSLQDIEDVRVAVDELAALLIEGSQAGAILELCFGHEGGALAVEGEVRGGGAIADLHPVARELLGLVADEYSVTVADHGGPSFRVVKRGAGSEA